MAATGYRSIVIQGGEVRLEGIAGEAGIKPGHLLEISSGEVVTHNTADGIASPCLVAVESPHANSPTLANIDVPYAEGDTVYYVQAQPGDALYMWLTTANNAVEGVSRLVSTNTGALKVSAAVDATLIAGAQVGVPHESLNNTSGSDARLAVRIG